MIQANELRIGSWIKDRGGKQWQIYCWESPNKVAAKAPDICILYGVHIYGHPLTEDVEYLLPIPLTPEILEKCGFEKEELATYFFTICYHKYLAKKELENEYFVFLKINSWIKGEHLGCVKMDKIKHLHQLQNLYFALTGEELQYTP